MEMRTAGYLRNTKWNITFGFVIGELYNVINTIRNAIICIRIKWNDVWFSSSLPDPDYFSRFVLLIMEPFELTVGWNNWFPEFLFTPWLFCWADSHGLHAKLFPLCCVFKKSKVKHESCTLGLLQFIQFGYLFVIRRHRVLNATGKHWNWSVLDSLLTTTERYHYSCVYFIFGSKQLHWMWNFLAYC